MKDEETLLRMNYLIQAAQLYCNIDPEYSSHLISEFVQLSEKKLIRMYSLLTNAETSSSREG